jgi:hypothetical protein
MNKKRRNSKLSWPSKKCKLKLHEDFISSPVIMVIMKNTNNDKCW